MQTIELVLVVSFGGVLTWLVAGRALKGGGGIVHRGLVGIGVGLLAALVVGALVGDLVPDELEGFLLGALALVISLVLVGALAMQRWAER